MKRGSLVLILALVSLLLGKTPAQAATTSFGGYTGSGPFVLPYTYAAPGDFSFQPCGNSYDPSGPVWYYDVQPFYVTAPGLYTLTITGSTFPFEDSVSVLYRDEFNPSAPYANCLGMNDEYQAGPPYHSQIATDLFVPGVQYFLVVAPVISGAAARGTYTGSISSTVGTALMGYVPGGAPDDRLNWRQGDDYAALYLRRDAAGAPVLHLYCVNEHSQGYLGAVWGADELAVPASLPTSNLLIASVDSCKVPVNLYLLTTGEWALHIGPNATGDVQALIWRGLPPTGMYEVRYNTTR